MKHRPDPDGYLQAELSRYARDGTPAGRQERIDDAEQRFAQAKGYSYLALAVCVFLSAGAGFACINTAAAVVVLPVIGGALVVGLVALNIVHKRAYVDLQVAHGYTEAEALRMYDREYGGD
jgi:hypothetical protein